MLEVENKNGMEHSAEEVFELSPLLEGDEQDSNHGREDEALLPREEGVSEESRYIAHDDTRQTIPPEFIVPQAFAKIEFLDGVRGLAAVWVFIQHSIGGYTMGAHEYGFGQNGDNWYFVQLPIVRLFFGNGGNAAVVIFFVLSGYVLSISSLRKLKQDKAPECRRALLSALIRRPLRLYIPPLVISFAQAMIMHIPNYFYLPVGWDGGRPQEGGIWAECEFFWHWTVEYFSLFREHGSHIWGFPYNAAIWTIPIELKGSLLVFGIMFILSLGMTGPNPRTPLMMAVLLFASGAIMLQRCWKWSMVAFMFGIILAILDTWPVGEEIKRGLAPPESLRSAWRKLFPKRSPRLSENSRSRWKDGRDILSRHWRAVRSVRVMPDWVSNVKVMPKWLSKRLSELFRSSHTTPQPAQPSSLWAHFAFWIGMLLLSQPSHAGDKAFSSGTLGWGWLTSLIPEEYGDARYYRYWQTWASLLVIYGVLRIHYLQRFFSTRALRFLGYTSFMLYLVHLPFFRILPDRISSLFGNDSDPHVAGTFWDKTLAIPNWGFFTFGIGLRFFVAVPINLGLTLLLAWVLTKTVDQPSVKLGKFITRVMRLDKPKASRKTTNEGSVVLPT